MKEFYYLHVVVTSMELAGLWAGNHTAKAGDASKTAHIVKYKTPSLSEEKSFLFCQLQIAFMEHRT